MFLQCAFTLPRNIHMNQFNNITSIWNQSHVYLRIELLRLIPISKCVIITTTAVASSAPKNLLGKSIWWLEQEFPVEFQCLYGGPASTSRSGAPRRLKPALYWMHACFLNISMHSPLTGKQWAGAYILRKCPLLFVKWGFPIKFPIKSFGVCPHKSSSAKSDRLLLFSRKVLLQVVSF